MANKVQKRFIAMALILIAVAVVVGASFVRQTFDNIFNNINTEIGKSSRIVSFEQQGWVERNKQFLEVLTALPEVVGNDRARCDKLLEDILKINLRFTNIGIMDLNGDQVCSGLPETSKINFADTVWFKDVISTNDFSVGDFQVGPITGRPIIIFGYPIFGSKGEIKKVAAVGLDLEWVHNLLNEIEIKEGSVAYVIDRNGIILAGVPDENNRVGEKFTEEEFLNNVINKDASTFKAIGADGINRIYASTSLSGAEENDLYFIFGVPLNNILAQTAKVAIPFIIVIIVGVFVLRDVFTHHRKEVISENVKTEQK